MPIDFAKVDMRDDSAELDVAPDDIFLTTSWWTTRATVAGLSNRNVFYLLQEDERMFYPVGDEHALCERVLRDAPVSFIVNSKLLFEHFGAQGLNNVVKRGAWFEPAFSSESFHWEDRLASAKRNFFLLCASP